MATPRLRPEPRHAVCWPYYYRLGLRHNLTCGSGKFWHCAHVQQCCCDGWHGNHVGKGEGKVFIPSKDYSSQQYWYTPTRSFLSNYYKELQNYVYYILRNTSCVLAATSRHTLSILFVKPKKSLMIAIVRILHTGGGTFRNIGWGCGTSFPKPLSCLRPKSATFAILFLTGSKI